MCTPAVQSDAAHSLPMRAVSIADDFWAPRIEQVRTRTIPQQEHQLRTGGQIEALKLQWRAPLGPRGDDVRHAVSAQEETDSDEPHIFWESDIAKWIEAASYSLAKHPDSQLDAAVDEVIGLLASAQQPDGYLNVYFTVVKPGQRFTDLRDAHELYNAGHLIEAGVAHFQATGKRTLLDVVQRYADLIDREFGPGGVADGGYDGHQESELALIRLAAATGESRYRSLAKRLLDNRGTKPFYFEAEAERRGTTGYFGSLFAERTERPEMFRQYNQSHKPVREQDAAVGHSVRAMYMYSAMADLAAQLGDDALRSATEALWASTTERKMYLTGGLGSDPHIEGFGPDFDLPLDDAYAETCAAIGLVLWSHRMGLMTGDARYVDVLERALYNGVLAGVSAEGTHYFYGNPMLSDGSKQRREWFGVACCPPNFARLIESLEYYAYAQRNQTAIINLYISGTAAFDFDSGHIDLTVDSDAPWGGRTRIVVETATADHFELLLRRPRWAHGHRLTINGDLVDADLELGYLRIARDWRAADEIVLELDIQPERVRARPEVSSTVGRVALQRGPFIHCFEGIDHDVPVDQLSLSRDVALFSEWDADRSLMLVHADGLAVDPDEEAAALYSSRDASSRSVRLTAVPYFSWANRGASTMEIWIREKG